MRLHLEHLSARKFFLGASLSQTGHISTAVDVVVDDDEDVVDGDEVVVDGDEVVVDVVVFVDERVESELESVIVETLCSTGIMPCGV